MCSSIDYEIYCDFLIINDETIFGMIITYEIILQSEKMLWENTNNISEVHEKNIIYGCNICTVPLKV